jgi:competence protein ComEC
MVTPAICAALGAALSYYGLQLFSPHGAALCIAFALLAAFSCIGLCRAFLYNPYLYASAGVYREKSYQFKVINRDAIALFTGFFIGAAAGGGLPPVQLGLPVEKISALYGTLQDDPRSFTNGWGTRGFASLALQRSRSAGRIETSASGTLPVFFPEGSIPRLKDFGRASELYIEGAFLPSESGGRERVFRATSVHIVKPAPAPEQFRSALRTNIAKRFSAYEWGGLALALLLGIKDNLDTELATQYQAAGCSHVLALSGMHLAIVSALLAFLLKKPLGGRAAALVSSCFIIGYVYLVGNIPSLNRAALMYLLGTVIVLGFLPRNPLSMLGLAFLLHIIFQSESGRSISFILSYLALAGILVLSGAFSNLMRGRAPDILAQSLAVSVSAFLATAAVSVLFFGVLRPVGIIASLVIIPLTTLFMIGALIALALSFIVPSLLPSFGTILSLLYNGIGRVVSIASLPDGLFITNPLPVLIITLAISALVLFAQYHKRNMMNGNYAAA